MKLSYMILCMVLMAGMTYLHPGASHCDLQKEDQERFYTVLFVLCAVCGLAAMTFPVNHSTGVSIGEGVRGRCRYVPLFLWLSLNKGLLARCSGLVGGKRVFGSKLLSQSDD